MRCVPLRRGVALRGHSLLRHSLLRHPRLRRVRLTVSRLLRVTARLPVGVRRERADHTSALGRIAEHLHEHTDHRGHDGQNDDGSEREASAASAATGEMIDSQVDDGIACSDDFRNHGSPPYAEPSRCDRDQRGESIEAVNPRCVSPRATAVAGVGRYNTSDVDSNLGASRGFPHVLARALSRPAGEGLAFSATVPEARRIQAR